MYVLPLLPSSLHCTNRINTVLAQPQPSLVSLPLNSPRAASVCSQAKVPPPPLLSRSLLRAPRLQLPLLPPPARSAERSAEPLPSRFLLRPLLRFRLPFFFFFFLAFFVQDNRQQSLLGIDALGCPFGWEQQLFLFYCICFAETALFLLEEFRGGNGSLLAVDTRVEGRNISNWF